MPRRPVPGTSVGAGALLHLLRDGVPRTRSELSALTGLARSTVTRRIDIHVTGADDVHCRCGNTSCLEAVASGAAIAKKLTEQGIRAGGSLDVVELARSGSVPALRLIRQAGRDIGDPAGLEAMNDFKRNG